VHVEHLRQSLLAQPSGFAEHPQNARIGGESRKGASRSANLRAACDPTWQAGKLRKKVVEFHQGLSWRLQLHVATVYNMNDYTVKLVDVPERIEEGRG